MFGDILSDEAGGIIGSLGLWDPPASRPVALYEPVHGSARYRGKGIANLRSHYFHRLMLRHSFKLEKEAKCVEAAVAQIVATGHRTRDLAKGGQTALTTSQMGQKIAEAVLKGRSRKSFLKRVLFSLAAQFCCRCCGDFDSKRKLEYFWCARVAVSR
jgi:3-isopropylmalate dehydrogenase